MTQLSLLPVYLLDSCVPIRLDGKDKVPVTPLFPPEEQALVWSGLERLAKDGRLKLITPVKQELQRWHPQALSRLKVYPGHRLVLRRTRNVILRYQALTAAYACLRPKLPHKKNPADPWLVIAAETWRYTIVTQELGIWERASKKRDLRIPDVCKAEGLPMPLNLAG